MFALSLSLSLSLSLILLLTKLCEQCSVEAGLLKENGRRGRAICS